MVLLWRAFGCWHLLVAVALGILCGQSALLASQSEEDFIPGAVHTIFSTDCKRYFTFQVMALVHSFVQAGQPGNLTRIASCTRDEIYEMPPEEYELVQTHFAPSWSVHPLTGDAYLPYNKPTGILHWLQYANPREEWILMVDADMTFRKPVTPETVSLTRGWAAGSYYNYLKGVNNELAQRHVPKVERRKDTYGGPKGRKADQVGAFVLVRNNDMRRLAPLWLRFTEEVRDNEDAWNLTGDSYAQPGEKVWIAEMYGYAFAAATLGIWHKLDPPLQSYAGYEQVDIPKLIHYGLNHKVQNYSVDKHAHYRFDSFMCPPWNMSEYRRTSQDGGLFPHPPHPSEVLTENKNERYGLLLVVEFVNRINEALCERHKRKCQPSEQLERECGTVEQIREALVKEYQMLDSSGVVCVDLQIGQKCAELKAQNYCEVSWLWMSIHCRATCGKCFAALPGSSFQAADASTSAQRDSNTSQKVSSVQKGAGSTEQDASASITTEKDTDTSGKGNTVQEDSVSTEKGFSPSDRLKQPKQPGKGSGAEDVAAQMESCRRKGAEFWMSDEDCRELITQGLLLNFTDVDAHSQEVWALLSPETRGDREAEQDPDEEKRNEFDIQSGRLVWGSQIGNSEWATGYSVVAFWIVVVGFLVYWIWSSSRSSQLRRRTHKKRSSP